MQLRTSPKPTWAIVTSATTLYASAALPTAGIAPPRNVITANHVTKGKPHPEPYLSGAKELDIDIKDCTLTSLRSLLPGFAVVGGGKVVGLREHSSGQGLISIGIVFEDAPSGIKSGVASGARVLAVCTSHKRAELEGLGAEWIVTDLTK